jgi:hypothetical protein
MDQLIFGKLPEWNGNGSGYGSGYGDGSGYGYGSGSGYGYGSGSGYGDGDGDGSGEYWTSTIQYFAKKWEPWQRLRLVDRIEAGATIAFWRSDQKGLPANGGKELQPAAAGIIHTAPGPLNLCCYGTLHATLLPPKWKGDRVWIVALTGEVIGDDEKYGALSREIIGEAL